MKLLLKGGRVVSPGLGDVEADVLVDNGMIAAIGAGLSPAGAQILEAAGLVIVPGLVDMHVHLREPGQEAKEDIVSGTRAAAAGGFTAVATMANTRPPIDNAALVQSLQRRAELEGAVKVFVVGAVSKGQEGKELAEIGDMFAAGAVAVSDDGRHVRDARLFRLALEYAGMFGRPVISHAEDEDLAGEGLMHEGRVSAMLGMRGRPAVAEDIAASRDIALAEYVQSLVHIAHVSTSGAVDAVRQAKRRGVRVTAEVTPHHLSLTDEELFGFNTAFKVNPPLRSANHIEALFKGIADGTIDAIASDHSPHAYEEKDVEFRYAPSGFAGLETSLGVVLTTLYHTGRAGLMDIVRLMSTNPCRILGLEGGDISVGKPADLTVLDLDAAWTVEAGRMYTRGKATPFDGRRLKGRAVATIVAGKLVMRDGEVLV